MARIRYIKPDFFLDDKLADLDPLVRILFAGLWVLADREGRLEDNSKKIKIQLLPYDKIDCDKALKELSDCKFIIRYEVDGKKYIQIVNFLKHQKPHHTERLSIIPECVGSVTVNSPLEDGEKLEGMGMGMGNGEGNGEGEIYLSSKLDLVRDIFDYWKVSLNHPKAVLDSKRKRVISARLKDGYSAERIKQAIEGIKYSAHHMGQNDRNTIYDDIELICRDGKHVDMFAEIKERTPMFKGADRYANAIAGLNLGDKNEE